MLHSCDLPDIDMHLRPLLQCPVSTPGFDSLVASHISTPFKPHKHARMQRGMGWSGRFAKHVVAVIVVLACACSLVPTAVGIRTGAVDVEPDCRATVPYQPSAGTTCRQANPVCTSGFAAAPFPEGASWRSSTYNVRLAAGPGNFTNGTLYGEFLQQQLAAGAGAAAAGARSHAFHLPPAAEARAAAKELCSQQTPRAALTSGAFHLAKDGSIDYEPHACTLPRLSALAMRECLADQHLAYVGDNIMRYHAFALAHFLSHGHYQVGNGNG